MDKAFKIYKSSAGSGKTFTLVNEYLHIALQNKKSDNYKHILAITFTNKAAQEMKERVMLYLKGLGSFDQDSSIQVIRQNLIKSLKIDDQELAFRANNTLKHILHHYSQFHISTIDKFVLNIVRSFSKELNLDNGFEIEMNSKNLFEMAVNEVVDQAGKSKEITNILTSFALQKSNEDDNWQIDSDIASSANYIYKEDAQEILERLKPIPHQTFIDYQKTLIKETGTFKTYLCGKAQEAYDFCLQHFSIDDFKGKTRGVSTFFQKIASGELSLSPSDAMLKNAANDDLFQVAFMKSTGASMASEVQKVYDYFNEIVEIQSKGLEQYIIQTNTLKSLFSLALLKEISEVIENKKAIHNFIHISEFNLKIHDIISQESVPFIYERIGEFYNHLMIDEFQDTSVLQWQNLIPLVENNLSKNNTNLVVGDAKQAIYRWRGGEVQQFIQLPELYKVQNTSLAQKQGIISHHADELFLKTNYRSYGNIIAFNNSFFETVKPFYPAMIQDVYEDVKQAPFKKPGVGYIEIKSFGDKATMEVDLLESLVTNIRTCLENGHRLADLCILVRKNNDAYKVADYLSSEKIPIVSNESFLLKEQPKVQFIHQLLKYLYQPSNQSIIIQLIDAYGDFQQWTGSDRISKHERLTQHGYRVEAFFQEEGIEFSTEKLAKQGLFDAVESIIDIFQLITTNDAYLDELLNFIHSNQHFINNNIGNYFELWNRHSSNLAIQIPEGLDAVQIMTIHKSKGLEFPVVFMPFAFELRPNTQFDIWIDTDQSPIPHALVKGGLEIESAKEANDREKTLIELDLINLLYVAFTRAEKELYIQTIPPSKTSKTPSTQKMIGHFLQGEPSFELGEKIVVSESNNEVTSSISAPEFHYANWQDKVDIAYQAKDIIQTENEIYINQDEKKKGNIIHQILSWAYHSPDANNLVQTAIKIGLIQKEDEEEYFNIISSVIQNPDLASFFQCDDVVKNEQGFLYHGQLYRADKLIISNKSVRILDYKTGKHDSGHIAQIKKYIVAVEHLGYEVVEAKLYYLNNAELVDIKKEGQLPLF